MARKFPGTVAREQIYPEYFMLKKPLHYIHYSSLVHKTILSQLPLAGFQTEQTQHLITQGTFYRSLQSGIYHLQGYASKEKYPVYCLMTIIPVCGPGGWTMVMKINGNSVRRITPYGSVVVLKHITCSKYDACFKSTIVFAPFRFFI